jgi:hypothetical protein
MEFVINLKTAKILGLQIPEKVLALVDSEIEIRRAVLHCTTPFMARMSRSPMCERDGQSEPAPKPRYLEAGL